MLFEEERYLANKWSFWAGGQAIKGSITGISSAVLTLASGAAGLTLSGVLTWGVLGTLGITLGSLLNKRILDMEHEREEHRMLGFYRKEIAAQTGRSPDEVNIDDLRTAALKNETLAEALEKNDKKVKSGMNSWLIGAVIATVVVGVLFAPMFGPTAILGGILQQGTAIGAVMADAAVKGLFGAVTFNITRPLTDYVADKISGIDKHNTHEYIKELSHLREQGRGLSAQQVMGAFVKANPAIEASIEQRYGKPFDKLVKKNDTGILAEIKSELEPRFNLDEVTRDINSGRISISELAYAARGKASGVEPVDPDTRTVKEKLQENYELAKQKAAEVKEVAQQKMHEAADHVSQAWQAGKEKLASLAHHAPTPVSSSFVERTGGPSAPQGTHVERLEQQEKRRATGLKTQLDGVG